MASPETLLYQLLSQVTQSRAQELDSLTPWLPHGSIIPAPCTCQFHHLARSPLAHPPSRLFFPLSSHPECAPLPASSAPKTDLFINNNNGPLHILPRALYYLEIAPSSHVFFQPLRDDSGRQSWQEGVGAPILQMRKRRCGSQPRVTELRSHQV